MARAVLLAAMCAVVHSQLITKISAWGRDGVRVQIAAPGGAIEEPPLSALQPGPPPGSSAWHALHLTQGNLAVTVDAASGAVTATRVSDGAVLLAPPAGAPAVVFSAPDVPGVRAGSSHARLAFAGLAAGEKIYGLGEHRTGSVNMAPYAKRFADSEDYGQSHGSDVSIPWYSSSRGYGFVWNSPAYGSVVLNTDGLAWEANATRCIDFYVTTTPATFDPAAGRSPYAELLLNYVDAVGHAPTMPYYATGFIQCKDRYRNQSQLLDVARGYVERGLPIAVIVIDWKHWVAQGDWQFNPACWPDPQAMVDELTTLGIEPMVTFWPFQTPQSSHWAEFTSSGFLATNQTGGLVAYDGDQYLVDETNAAARAAVFAGFWNGYGKYGFKTVWIDAAEPEHFGASAEGTWRLAAGTDAEVMPAWTQQHARALAEGFASKGIGPSDYFILPRSAWAGSWTHSAALWSGDIASTFDELALQVRALQGVMMSGVALWTTDIGGYFGGDPADATFQELIVRWFQFGAFCPLFRLHGHRAGGPPDDPVCGGTNGDNEVWNLAPDPAHYDAIVAVMRLRENLREYVAQVNAEAAATGVPMVRPMFLQFPLDAGCAGADVEDQFMFGSQWLVAPVLEARAASRSVFLPALVNQTWVYFFNQTSVGAGGARATLPTPIGEFPLFYIQDVTPPPPPQLVNLTTLFSASRADTVACVSPACFDANAPGQDGDYVALRVEGAALANDPSGGALTAVIDGVAYPLAPLTLRYSFNHTDNFVAADSAPPPDATYDAGHGATVFADGFILARAPPNGAPVSVWYKRFAGSSQDFATVASADGVAWVTARGYAKVNDTIGWLLPA